MLATNEVLHWLPEASTNILLYHDRQWYSQVTTFEALHLLQYVIIKKACKSNYLDSYPSTVAHTWAVSLQSIVRQRTVCLS